MNGELSQNLPKITIDGEEFEVCPFCLNADPGEESLLEELFENVGFDECPHYEVYALRCKKCGRTYQL